MKTVKGHVELSEVALAKIFELARARASEGLAVRIYAEREGCSTPQFGMAFDRPQPQDLVEHISGFTFVVDHESANVVARLTIDYVEEDGRHGFTFRSASAESAPCGCST